MVEVTSWYLATLAIGTVGILPATALFPHLRSRGVLFARPLGLILLSVGLWWIGWSGVLPYGSGALYLLLGTSWIVTTVVVFRRPECIRTIAIRWRLLILGELIFIVIFGLLALARAQAPNAQHTEKPMDLLMLMAVNRSDALPPLDPWLSGATVSYYHLGHLAIDIVGRLSRTGPEIGFNLGIAMIGGFAGVAIFGLASDVLALSHIRKRSSSLMAGFTGVFALLWVAPLASHRDILSILRDTDSSLRETWWWWWDATRVLPQPISEFPAFSFLLGDLHAHVLALPIALISIAISVSTFQERTPLTVGFWLKYPIQLVLVSAVFAALFMTNSWDVVTFGLLWWGASMLALHRTRQSWFSACMRSVSYLALPIAISAIMTAPFVMTLDSVSRSVSLVSVEASDPSNWLLIWIVPLLPLILAAISLQVSSERSPALIAGSGAASTVIAWALLQLLFGNPEALVDRSSGWIVLAFLIGMIAIGSGAIVRSERRDDRAMTVWLALAVGAAVMMLATELVNIDTATPGRFNTVFKLWYHLWVIIAVAGAVALAMAYDRIHWRTFIAYSRKPTAVIVGIVCVVCYSGAFVYAPAMAINRAHEGQPEGLDALVYLNDFDPGLAGAIEFARQKLDPQRHVLLQAVGESYSSNGYLSAASGVPTVINWPGHQQQWRGIRAAIDERREAVYQFYRLGAVDETEAIAQKYGVTHVYVGSNERIQFGKGVVARFADWPIVWEGDDSLIFAVPNRQSIDTSW